MKKCETCGKKFKQSNYMIGFRLNGKNQVVHFCSRECMDKSEHSNAFDFKVCGECKLYDTCITRVQ